MNRVRIAAIFLGSLAACGGEEDGSGQNDADGGRPTAEAGRDAGVDAARVYAMVTHAVTPDTVTSYLVSTPSLAAGSAVELAKRVQVPNWQDVVGIPGTPTAWLASDEAPTLQRWDLQPDGSFKAGATLDLSRTKLSSAGQAANGAFVSDQLAAFANNDTGTLIFWNPTTMALLGELDLAIPRSGEVSAFIRSVTKRSDGSLIAGYYYLSPEGVFSGNAGIVVVDPVKRTILGRDEYEGCNCNYARTAPDGSVYFTVGAEWLQRALVSTGEQPYLAKPCLLRVLPGATRFDREFARKDLGQLVGRKVAGTLELRDDGQAFFVAWHEELAPALTAENFDQLAFTAPAYKWYQWDLRAPTASEVPNADPVPSPTVTTLDGRLYFADERRAGENGGLGEVPNFELTADGVLPAFTSYGTSGSVLRLR